MTAVRVEFHRLALKEYDEACHWYAQRSLGSRERFIAAVDDAIKQIADDPDRMQRYSGDYRWVRVKRFRYLIVFRRRVPDEVVVVAVPHTSRRPGYWKRRTI